MKINVTVKTEVEVFTLRVNTQVRYWEDSSVNGVEDTEGNLIPCREGESWCPLIDIKTGKITNWEDGKSASVHYKVCDAGQYEVLDERGKIICSIDGYVPKTMCPAENGDGDYIIMEVDEKGIIANWKFYPSDFEHEPED